MQNTELGHADPFDGASLMTADSLSAGLKDRSAAPEEKRHNEIVERVIDMFNAAKRDQAGAAAPFQPSGEWTGFIAERADFYSLVERREVAQVADILREFWRDPLLGVIVKEYAKYDQLTGSDDRTVAERFCRNVSRNFRIWQEIYRFDGGVLDVPDVGNPWGLVLDGRLVVPKASRHHAHAATIADLATGIEGPVVAEIGGGYGGMAYYLLRDNPGLTYLDFDLPETLLIAAYYLLAALPERQVLLYGETGDPISEAALAGHDAVLLPNYSLPGLQDLSVDVYLNAFSLSEMRPNTIAAYLTEIARTTRGYFLHNNMDRTGVVNRGFERIPASSYPIDPTRLKRLYKHFDLFHGQQGDYREFLYARV